MDDLYFTKPDSGHTFHTADGINAYKVSFKNSDYLFLFASYSSGMFSGTCLFVFHKKATDNTAKFIYFKEQLSENMNCFGVDTSENKLVYYEWCMTHGKINDYYNNFEISDSICYKQKTNNLEIRDVNPFQIIFCK